MSLLRLCLFNHHSLHKCGMAGRKPRLEQRFSSASPQPLWPLSHLRTRDHVPNAENRSSSSPANLNNNSLSSPYLFAVFYTKSSKTQLILSGNSISRHLRRPIVKYCSYARSPSDGCKLNWFGPVTCVIRCTKPGLKRRSKGQSVQLSSTEGHLKYLYS